MKTSKIILDRSYTIGKIDKRLFGSFVEHLGRCVYEGIYEPSHPLADASGFRKDVLELVKNLGVTIVRYPGGNFVSGFHWEDSIGPISQRPRRTDLAWKTTETNEVGLHEFAEWCKKAGTDLIYTVNLGTRGADDAKNVLEYANHPGGSYWSDLRKQNGAKAPFRIPVWCLGNEMDAPWQVGQKTAIEYGRTARETAKVMKLLDPSVELVACGATGPSIETFGSWELAVLDECYDYVDYISLHRYYENYQNDTASFLAETLDMEDYIRSVISFCDAIKGKHHTKKTLNLSFDEWNIWYHSKERDNKIIQEECWKQTLPILEDVYNFEDALLTGLMLITMLKHSDRIKIACLAQLVNVIAPIMTQKGGKSWVQTIYYPFMYTAKYAKGGTVLSTLVETPQYCCHKYDAVPYIDAVAVLGEDHSLSIFCVNRDMEESHTVTLDLRSFGPLRIKEHILLSGHDVNDCNSADNLNCVQPKKGPGGTLQGNIATFIAPALSWNLFRLETEVSTIA